MTLEPLMIAQPAIQLHVAAIAVAVALTPVQWLAARGGPVHRASGRLWIVAMAAAAGSSFFIHELRAWGPFSPIHLLSVGTLLGIGAALAAARRGNARLHRIIMTSIVWGALVGAGAFTLLPGRIMNAVLLGP